jgi:uncharacterized protein involved in exopolysaccharide biosynthesis
MRSRAILGKVATAQYEYGFEDGPESGTLLDLYANDDPPEIAEKKVVRLLRDMIDSEVLGAQMISIEVEAPTPTLAEQIASELIRTVDEWSRQHRQTKALVERDFVAESVERARAELLEAESEMEDWLEKNVRFEGSPQKVFEHDRLKRRVELKQSVYQTLAQTLEQVRINVVRNTPAIVILDPPESDLEPKDRGLILELFKGLVLGAAVGFVFALGADGRVPWLRRLDLANIRWPRRRSTA